MSARAETIATVGAVLFTVGLWIERPSLAFMFVGALAMAFGGYILYAAKRGQQK